VDLHLKRKRNKFWQILKNLEAQVQRAKRRSQYKSRSKETRVKELNGIMTSRMRKKSQHLLLKEKKVKQIEGPSLITMSL